MYFVNFLVVTIRTKYFYRKSIIIAFRWTYRIIKFPAYTPPTGWQQEAKNKPCLPCLVTICLVKSAVHVLCWSRRVGDEDVYCWIKEGSWVRSKISTKDIYFRKLRKNCTDVGGKCRQIIPFFYPSHTLLFWLGPRQHYWDLFWFYPK